MSFSPDVIYFGGTFDPIHLGHVDAVRIVHERFPTSKIVLVPAYCPPKSATESKPVATEFIDRVAMCVVAFDDYPYVDVSSIEEELSAPNYTVSTIKALKAENPDLKVAWLIGGDQLSNFQNWKSPLEILEQAALIVVPRKSESILDLKAAAAGMLGHLGCEVRQDEGNVLALNQGGPVVILDQVPKDVSSTKVRDTAAKNIKEATDLVPAPVLDYIVDLELYQA
jgi:nicotinate-nucleotide adenylyltransferase